MKRRDLVLAGFGGLATYAIPGFAKQRCQMTKMGQHCVAEVDFATFAQEAFQQQTMSQWCWAASISMLFRYYGYSVRQERIVAETYGNVVNMPAGAGFVIARQVNRNWVDDDGKTFRARLTAAFDADAGVGTVNNQMIVQELRNDRPILVGARTHAMVMTAIAYFPTAMGPNVASVGVFDPFPGIGARGLQPDEMVPIPMGGSLRFVATVRVS